MSPKINLFDGSFDRVSRITPKLNSSANNVQNKNAGIKAIHFYNQVGEYGMPTSLDTSQVRSPQFAQSINTIVVDPRHAQKDRGSDPQPGKGIS